jgi:lipid II:glycine glycyltransferase (peptidoglycan interpeptide bridge formation enzyme)
VNHHIAISKELFVETIRKQEKQRLNKCIKAGFISQIEPCKNVAHIYNFLQSCRAQKGYDLSLNEEQLKKLLTTFPDKVIVFTIRHNNRLIALSVTIRVNTRILYNFLTNSLPQYNLYSPSVFLTECIYSYCQTEQIQILDLGTSLDHHGHEKAGLLRFKDNTGGKRSWKVTYSKDFFFV